jgi:predicted GH43/DUF377 family glycosyl hydrolase
MATLKNKKTKSSIKTIFKKIVSSKKPDKKVIKKKVLLDIKPDKIKKVLVKKKAVKKPAIKKIVKNKLVLKKKKLVLTKNKTVRRFHEEYELKLNKSGKNPILGPGLYSWESQAVFNPAALHAGGLFHLFYRAVGDDGISRIGYASSKDGINFDNRLTYPVYTAQNIKEVGKHWPFTSPARLVYDRDLYPSGGSWGGCEDPRSVVIDGVVYVTLNIFNGWSSLRVGVISIKEEDLLKRKWKWSHLSYITRLGDRQKNWVLFPEKFNGKFGIFHNLDLGDPTRVGVSFVTNLDSSESPQGSDPGSEAPDPQRLPDRIVAWHKHTRSASCPPIKTKDGWLLLYHAMDKDGNNLYKLGAMLLDLKDPRKVLYRAISPILEPDEWYENDWKPGIIYASGAVVKNGELFVYYGGGDKHVAVAYIRLETLLNGLKNNKEIKLTGKSKAINISK